MSTPKKIAIIASHFGIPEDELRALEDSPTKEGVASLLTRLEQSVQGPKLSHAQASSKPADILNFLQQAGGLKRVPRTGWLRFINNPESVADHSWRTALMASFAPPGLDVDRCIKIALAHDLAETFVGDIPMYANVSEAEKHERERLALSYTASLLQGSQGEAFLNWWSEYEEQKTPESHWVKECDKFECMQQAAEYEAQYGIKLDEFQRQRNKLKSPLSLDLLREYDVKRNSRSKAEKANLVIVLGATEELQLPELCTKLGINYFSLEDVLAEKAQLEDYRYAKYISDCLRASFPTVMPLNIDLLKESISRSSHPWTIVEGFPNSIEELKYLDENLPNVRKILCLPSANHTASHDPVAYRPLDIASTQEDLKHYCRKEGQEITELGENRSDVKSWIEKATGSSTRANVP